MAKKRRVDNLLALAVLSTVIERPMHRYEMASLMRARGKDQDMDIKWGSLYTVVQNLEKHGLVETIGNTRQGARPERTIYRITDAGRQELLDWTRELIGSPTAENPKFAAGLSVWMLLAPDEVAKLLRTRLDELEASVETRRAALAHAVAEIPRLFLVEAEYALAMTKAEAAWVRSLLAELSSDKYPDLAAWRKWHATGEMPAEFAELAKRGSTSD
jgi:DNA-binding PadR family transcriptional regulator